MKLAFVDYENLMTLKNVALSSYNTLIIFCGKTQNTLTFGEMPTGSGSHLCIIKIPDQGKNNLDFHMAFELGRRHELEDQAVEFHVLTKDTDLDKLLKHLRLLGRKCLRVDLQLPSEETAVKPAKKSPPAKKAVVIAHHDPLSRVLTDLRALPLAKRPKKRTSLLNWIASRIGQTGKQERILARLMERKEIQTSGESITYHLPCQLIVGGEAPPSPATANGVRPPSVEA